MLYFMLLFVYFGFKFFGYLDVFVIYFSNVKLVKFFCILCLYFFIKCGIVICVFVCGFFSLLLVKCFGVSLLLWCS